MSANNWQRAADIFALAVEGDVEERLRIVREACGDDEALYADVSSLLEHDCESTRLKLPPFQTCPEERTPVGAEPGSRLSPLSEVTPRRFNPTLERDYREAVAADFVLHISRFRSALLLGILIYGCYGAVDWLVVPADYSTLWTIRLIVVSAAGLLYAVSFAKQFVVHWEVAMTALTAAAAIGILTMIAILPPPASYLYYAALIIMANFYCTLTRLGFWTALGLSFAILSAYVALGWYAATPELVVVNNATNLAGAMSIALMANYTLEQHSRRDFWQRRTIAQHATVVEEQNAALSRMNQELRSSQDQIARAAERGELLFAALTEALSGSVLDQKYRLDAPIGTGGFGTVYRGFHLFLQRPVAVKVLRPSNGDVRASVARFRREAMAAALLRHENAVEVMDFGVVAGSVGYLVMELLHGETLSVMIDRVRALNLSRCAEIVVPLCRGIAHAHERGVVHCDLKPSNIVLDHTAGPERVTIVDFGIAKLNDDVVAGQASRGLTTSIAGTPAYIAPERLTGHHYDHRVDVYSVGVMMFEMLTGRRPFVVSGVWEVTLPQLSRDAPSIRTVVEGIPSEICALVDAALSREPSQRPSIDVIGSAFSQFLPAGTYSSS